MLSTRSVIKPRPYSQVSFFLFPLLSSFFKDLFQVFNYACGMVYVRALTEDRGGLWIP